MIRGSHNLVAVPSPKASKASKASNAETPLPSPLPSPASLLPREFLDPHCSVTVDVFKKLFGAIEQRRERMVEQRKRDEEELHRIETAIGLKGKTEEKPDLSRMSDAELAEHGRKVAGMEVALRHLHEASRRHAEENRAIRLELIELGRMQHRVIDAAVSQGASTTTLSKIFEELNVC